MKSIKDNKTILIKYSLIILFNVLTFIFCDFYFKSSDKGFVIMLVINFVLNLFIYNYKEQTKFKYYLDILCNIIIGLILLIFIKDIYYYTITTLSLYLSNNIVFMKSRISDKFFKRSIQYILIFFLTVLSVLISNVLFYLVG